MILVSVGSQTPFDRLVRTVDDWAGAVHRTDIIAQIGPSDFRPHHIQWTRFLKPSDFRDAVVSANLVVGHAGIGTIVTCLELETPLVVMPRLSSLRETRNDHQSATAKRFEELGYVSVAWSEQALIGWLNDPAQITKGKGINAACDEQLLTAIREFINAT